MSSPNRQFKASFFSSVFRTPEGANTYGSVNYELPMTLSVYNVQDKKVTGAISNWAPTQNQWWITVFNPNYLNHNQENLATIGSIDFSGHEDFWDGLEYAKEHPDESNWESSYYESIIIDEDGHTVWTMW